MILATAVVQQSSLGTGESIVVTVVGGLIVVFVPFVIKYFRNQFSQITNTAQESAEIRDQVEKHHKQNKKRLNKIDNELVAIKELHLVPRPRTYNQAPRPRASSNYNQQRRRSR